MHSRRVQRLALRNFQPHLNNYSDTSTNGECKARLPQITKSIRPNSAMVLSTAALSWAVWRTSAWAGTQSCPLASESSFAAFVILSALWHNTKCYSSDGTRKETRIWAVSCRTYFLPTITAFAPCFIYVIQSVQISKLALQIGCKNILLLLSCLDRCLNLRQCKRVPFPWKCQV